LRTAHQFTLIVIQLNIYPFGRDDNKEKKDKTADNRGHNTLKLQSPQGTFATVLLKKSASKKSKMIAHALVEIGHAHKGLDFRVVGACVAAQQFVIGCIGSLAVRGLAI
jgi:hypothetical protein